MSILTENDKIDKITHISISYRPNYNQIDKINKIDKITGGQDEDLRIVLTAPPKLTKLTKLQGRQDEDLRIILTAPPKLTKLQGAWTRI